MLCRPELRGTQNAVSSTHWLATAAGSSMFDLGGNAFDAATAAAFVIQVVEPHLNGPAGDVPIMIHDGSTGRVQVICGQGPMPEAATISRFQELGIDSVPGSGLLAACVPGAFGAWMVLLRDHGRLTPAEVLAPAIRYAEVGFPLLPTAAGMIDVLAPLFREEWTESGRTYLQSGAAPAPGSMVRNPVLGSVFRRLVAEAEAASAKREPQIDGAIDAFYEGFVAEAIDTFMTTSTPLDATGQRNGGLLTGGDLASWRPTVEEPCALDFQGMRVHKPGTWSQGPVFLQQLALLDGSGLSDSAFGSFEHLDTVLESAKLAFADREAWYGDPDFADIPIKTLLSREYAVQRRALIDGTVSDRLRPGSPDGRSPLIPPVLDEPPTPPGPAWMGQLGQGIPAIVKLTAANGDTCCISAADRDGNLVVATPSGGWLKSSPVVPGLGFPMGTRGQMAWLMPDHPNALAPGKRPRTTLSPTLVTRDGRAYLGFGTPGGDQQDQWSLNFFLNHVVFGMGVQEAVEAPTFFSDHVPTSFAPRRARPRTAVLEDGFAATTLERLRARGHDVVTAPAMSQGKVCATGFGGDGFLLAAASPRGAQAYGAAR